MGGHIILIQSFQLLTNWLKKKSELLLDAALVMDADRNFCVQSVQCVNTSDLSTISLQLTSYYKASSILNSTTGVSRTQTHSSLQSIRK